mmetsp:Transcript_340/g.421  ORF Transcript_340/g.421 Transcript_340/m.421 type:complete len:476 (-) Transcript_340:409-1836(-)
MFTVQNVLFVLSILSSNASIMNSASKLLRSLSPRSWQLAAAGSILVLGSNTWTQQAHALPEEGTEESRFRLVNAHVIFRHGARTPVFHCKGLEHLVWDKCNGVNRPVGLGGGKTRALSNVYFQQLHVVDLKNNGPRPFSYVDDRSVKKDWFPGGTCRLGQLTDKGAQQASLLGQRLLQRYGDMIEHNHKNIIARSTNVARCLATLSAVLGSMTSDQVHDAITVYTLRNHDEYLTPNTRICEKMSQIIRSGREEWMKEPNTNVQKFISELKEIVTDEQFQMLGLNKNNFVRYRDWVVAILAHDLPLPWELDDRQIKELDRFGLEQVAKYIGYGRDALTLETGMKLSLGRYVSEVIEEIKLKKEGILYLTSAHDTTLIPLLIILDLMDNTRSWPGFCSDIAIELWEDLHVAEPNEMITNATSDNRYYIRILYNGEEQYKVLLSEFEELLETRLPSSWDSECKVKHGGKLLSESGSHF